MIAVCIISRWITIIREDIQRFPDRHCRPDNRYLYPSDCPCHSKYPICCPCLSLGPSRHIHPLPGPTLIIVPAGLIQNWQREWNNAVAPHSKLDLTLLVGHARNLLPGFTQVTQWAWQSQRQSVGDNVVMITSTQSYYTHVQGPTQQLTITWGRAIRDESHQERNERETCKILTELPGNPPRYFLTGTPFETSPLNIQPYIQCIGGLSTELQNTLKDIGSQFRRACDRRDRDSTQAQLQRFSTILRGLLFIRRTCRTQWFDQALIQLPAIRIDLVECQPPTTALTTQRQQENRLFSQTGLASATKLHQLRVTATLPSMVRISGSFNLPLTGPLEEHQPAYQSRLQSIIHDSAKIRWLIATVRQQISETPNKLLIFSEFPVIALVVWLALKADFPQLYPKLITAATRNRDDHVRGFNDYHTGGIYHVQATECHSPGILVSTHQILGVGFTCTRARYAVIMEPALLKSTEEQSAGRIHRIGQRYTTTVWRLYNNTSEAERRILQRHQQRQGLREQQ